jgi:hypothetical protein
MNAPYTNEGCAAGGDQTSVAAQDQVVREVRRMTEQCRLKGAHMVAHDCNTVLDVLNCQAVEFMQTSFDTLTLTQWPHSARDIHNAGGITMWQSRWRVQLA